MRIVAASSHLVPGFEPTGFTRLPDPDATRLFITDGETEVVASLYPPATALREDTEQIAAALVRTLLPNSAIRFPEVLATLRVSGEDWGLVEEHELVLTRPLPGTPLVTSAFTEHPELVTELAAFLAALHSCPTDAVADAGLVTQEPLEVRDALLADLDRGAATGRVPHTLLSRWETLLETAGVWHFLPAVLHGNLGLDALRTDEGRLAAVTDLDQLRVGDPALDLAAVADLLEAEDFSRLLAAYLAARKVDDPHLVERIGLVSELSVLQLLLATVDAGDADGTEEAVALLEQLAEIGGLAPAPVGPQETPDAPAAPATGSGAGTGAGADSAADSAAPQDGIDPEDDNDTSAIR